MVSNNHINIMKSLPREIKLYFMASWLGVTHDIELVALKYELLLAKTTGKQHYWTFLWFAFSNLPFHTSSTVTFESWWFIPSASHSQLDQQQQQKSNKNNIHLKRWDLLDCRIFDFHYHRPLVLSFVQASEIHCGAATDFDMIHCEEQMNKFPGISCDSEQAPGWRQQRWALCAGSWRQRETALCTVEKLHSKTRPCDAWLVVWPISRSWDSIYLANNLRRRCRTWGQENR